MISMPPYVQFERWCKIIISLKLVSSRLRL